MIPHRPHTCSGCGHPVLDRRFRKMRITFTTARADRRTVELAPSAHAATAARDGNHMAQDTPVASEQITITWSKRTQISGTSFFNAGSLSCPHISMSLRQVGPEAGNRRGRVGEGYTKSPPPAPDTL